MGVCLLLPVVIPADPDLMYFNVISFQWAQTCTRCFSCVVNNTLRMVHPDSFRGVLLFSFASMRRPNTTPVDPCLSVHANDSSVPEGTKGFV